MKRRLFIIIVLILGAIYAGWIFKSVFISQGGSGEMISVNIQNGLSLDEYAKKLEDAGVISSKAIFKKYVKIRNYEEYLVSGIYSLRGDTSIRQLVNILISGSVSEKVITILEGWNLRDLAEELITLEVIGSEEELYNLTGLPAGLGNVDNEITEEYQFFSSKPSGSSLEGFIFPDTYRISARADATEVLLKAFNHFQNIYEVQLKPKLLAGELNLYQALTLASIVNKEAREYEDKRMVAGVFLNRLALGQALQSDATVNYITEKVTDNPSLDDIATDSPYNTYKYAGLPPGPISNPGLEDILAVLDPIEHDYYYFLNTKQGELIYSRSFSEHVKNRDLYNQ